MTDKYSMGKLKRLIESAVADVCGLPRLGLWFCVDEVEASGHPPEALKVWATLHFLPAGSPFCCGEPGCHLGLNGAAAEEVSEQVRRGLRLEQGLTLDFTNRIGVNYHSGVTFHYGQGET